MVIDSYLKLIYKLGKFSSLFYGIKKKQKNEIEFFKHNDLTKNIFIPITKKISNARGTQRNVENHYITTRSLRSSTIYIILTYVHSDTSVALRSGHLYIIILLYYIKIQHEICFKHISDIYDGSPNNTKRYADNHIEHISKEQRLGYRSTDTYFYTLSTFIGNINGGTEIVVVHYHQIPDNSPYCASLETRYHLKLKWDLYKTNVLFYSVS